MNNWVFVLISKNTSKPRNQNNDTEIKNYLRKLLVPPKNNRPSSNEIEIPHWVFKLTENPAKFLRKFPQLVGSTSYSIKASQELQRVSCDVKFCCKVSEIVIKVSF